MKILFAAILFASLTSCGYANLDEGKSIAATRWEQAGYEVIGYEGFQWGIWLGGCYGGARVWHQLRKIPDDGVRFTGYISKWCDDGWQIYGPTAVDAIKPH